MNVNEKILKRLTDLISMGEKVLSTQYSLGPTFIGDDRVDSQLVMQWVTSIQNLLSRVFGKESVHLKNVNSLAAKHITYSPAKQILGVLEAAKDDFEQGFIFEIKTIIEAELFDDFLEQAEYLLETGYYQPAAVIAGCILEDGLRKLCDKNEIAFSERPKLDRMNADLAKSGIYNKLVQKQITAYADLRNKAAHGQWDEFNSDDVKGFTVWIRSFMGVNF
jgi:hypothetical protein